MYRIVMADTRGLDTSIAHTQVAFEVRVQLRRTAGTEGWLSCASHFLLNGGARSFEVKVDPTALPEGVHVAEVRECVYSVH